MLNVFTHVQRCRWKWWSLGKSSCTQRLGRHHCLPLTAHSGENTYACDVIRKRPRQQCGSDVVFTRKKEHWPCSSRLGIRDGRMHLCFRSSMWIARPKNHEAFAGFLWFMPPVSRRLSSGLKCLAVRCIFFYTSCLLSAKGLGQKTPLKTLRKRCQFWRQT